MRTDRRRRAAAYGAAFALTLAAAGGIGTAAAAATPGNAAPASTDSLGCPSGDACFWVDGGWNGTMGHVSGDNSNYLNLSNSSGCVAYPGTWNDCIASIDNNGNSCTVYFWTGANYSGRYHSLSIGDAVDSFGVIWNDPNFTDAISSNHWCTSK